MKISLEKQYCLAWAETNQNRELKISQGCYLDSLWLTKKIKESSLSLRC